jgi:hypothetical protein
MIYYYLSINIQGQTEKNKNKKKKKRWNYSFKIIDYWKKYANKQSYIITYSPYSWASWALTQPKNPI